MDLFIDVGSTNIKWMDESGKANRLPFPAPERSDYPFFEVDAEKIYADIEEIIRSVLPQRVFFSVQMHGYVLLKRGKAVTKYISWRDERGGKLVPEFSLSAEYGVKIKPNLPRLSLQAQSVEADEFCTLGSYLVYRLTGINKTHITDGAASGFFNVVKRTSDKAPYSLFRVAYSVEEAGRYAASRIFTPVGDQQAAILGAKKRAEANGFKDCYILNLGTAAQLCAISKRFVSGDFESRPYFNGETLCTVTKLLGGGYLHERAGKKSEAELAEELYVDYAAAMKKLPERNRLLITGGVVAHRRRLLEKVGERLGRECMFNDSCDALDGLKIISEVVA